MLDPFNVMGAFARGAKEYLRSPKKIVQANMELWQKHAELWQYATDRILGQEAEPEKGDRRFKGKEWQEHIVFDVIRQSYLITSNGKPAP